MIAARQAAASAVKRKPHRSRRLQPAHHPRLCPFLNVWCHLSHVEVESIRDRDEDEYSGMFAGCLGGLAGSGTKFFVCGTVAGAGVAIARPARERTGRIWKNFIFEKLIVWRVTIDWKVG